MINVTYVNNVATYTSMSASGGLPNIQVPISQANHAPTLGGYISCMADDRLS